MVQSLEALTTPAISCVPANASKHILGCNSRWWTGSLVLSWQVVDRGLRGDHAEFHPLVEQVLVPVRCSRLLADGDCNSETNPCWLREELGIETIMPPVIGRPQRGIMPQAYRRQMQLAFPVRADSQRRKADQRAGRRGLLSWRLAW
jgi:hypothetical protein